MGKKLLLFSSEYFTLVKPFYQLLADAGQKVITAYIKDGAFNKGQTMVKWHEAADGKWSFDYTGFDKFVAQMMSWGDWQTNQLFFSGGMEHFHRIYRCFGRSPDVEADSGE